MLAQTAAILVETAVASGLTPEHEINKLFDDSIAGLALNKVQTKAVQEIRSGLIALALSMKPNDAGGLSKSETLPEMNAVDPQVVQQIKDRLENARSESELKAIVADFEKYLRSNDQIKNLRSGALDYLLYEFGEITTKKDYVIGKNPSDKGKRALLLFRVLRGKNRTYQNKNRFINFYYLMLKTEDDEAIKDPMLAFHSRTDNFSAIFTDNMLNLAKKLVNVKRGANLKFKMDLPDSDKLVVEKLLAIEGDFIRRSLFDENLKQILDNLGSFVYSMAFEHHRIRQMRGMSQLGQSDEALDMKLETVFSLYDETNPALHFGLIIETAAAGLTEKKPGAWETLYGLSNTDKPEGVFKWLKELLEIKGTPDQVRQEMNNEIRQRAERYYTELSKGRAPVKANGFVLYIPPQTSRPPSTPVSGSTTGQPANMLRERPETEAAGLIQVISLSAQPVDRFELVSGRLRKLFENPESDNPDGINRLIAKAKGRHGRDPYHDALEAIANEVSGAGVSIFSLMAEGNSGVTRIEEQILKVMQGIDKIKNLSFKAYFDTIPAVTQSRGPGPNGASLRNGRSTFTEDNLPVSLQAPENEIAGPELYILRNKHIKTESWNIEKDVKDKILKIYQRIKLHEEGVLDVRDLGEYIQSIPGGIYGDYLRNDGVFYFRYFKQENKILIIALESKDEGHDTKWGLRESYRGYLSHYSGREFPKFEDLDVRFQHLGVLDAAMVTKMSSSELFDTQKALLKIWEVDLRNTRDEKEKKEIQKKIRSLKEQMGLEPKTGKGRYNRAMISNPGGIDLNSANMAMVIKRDGKGVPLPLSQQDMAQLSRIQGFVPVILEIKPATDLPILNELKQKLQNQPQFASVT